MSMQDQIRKLDRLAGANGRGAITVMPSGAVIVLDRTDPQGWRLAIGNLVGYANLAECTEIATLLNVPQGTKRHFREKHGAKDTYWIVEYIWRPDGSPVVQPGVMQPPLDLELAPIRQIEATDDAPIEERFRQFHEANPQVYSALRQLAIPLARQGRRRIGVKMLWEVLRYSYWVTTQGDPYQLNNSYTSRYARLLMNQEPELRGLIETRQLRA
jgi:hypothetical protein